MDSLLADGKLDFPRLIFNFELVECVIDWVIVVVLAVKLLFEGTDSRKLKALDNTPNGVFFLLRDLGNRSNLRMCEHGLELLQP